MLKLYGIRSCDTVRKARRWLEARGIEYHYCDLRDDGVSAEQLSAWLETLGPDALINRRSTTWRSLPEAARESMDEERAVAVLLEHPTLLRRPLLELGSELRSGFRADSWEQLLEAHRL